MAKKSKTLMVNAEQEAFLQKHAGKDGNGHLAKKTNRKFGTDFSPEDIGRLRQVLDLPHPKKKQSALVDPRIAFVTKHAHLYNDQLARRIEEKFKVITKPDDVDQWREKAPVRRDAFGRAAEGRVALPKVHMDKKAAGATTIEKFTAAVDAVMPSEKVPDNVVRLPRIRRSKGREPS